MVKNKTVKYVFIALTSLGLLVAPCLLTAAAQTPPPKATSSVASQVCLGLLNQANANLVETAADDRDAIERLKQQVTDLQKQLADEQAKNTKNGPKPDAPADPKK